MSNDKLSPEVRQAIAKAYDIVCDQAKPTSEGFLELVEEKLSHKYPPKGAICEVWDDDFDPAIGSRPIGVSMGDGRFDLGYDKDSGFSESRYDHYRRIVTAENALARLKGCRGGWTSTVACEDYGRGFSRAIDIVTSLIDNAEMGEGTCGKNG